MEGSGHLGARAPGAFPLPPLGSTNVNIAHYGNKVESILDASSQPGSHLGDTFLFVDYITR